MVVVKSNPLQGDFGFALPINVARLRNERLSLIPLKSNYEELGAAYVLETKDHRQSFDYLPYGPFDETATFLSLIRDRIESQTTTILFAIVLHACTIRKLVPDTQNMEDITVDEGTFAGVTGLLNADAVSSVVEIGHINIVPRFQRTFVASQAHGLLLRHLLDPLPQDLNLRRVQWQANSANVPSIRAAQRLGFQFEGVIRWSRVLPEGKKGIETDDEVKNGFPVTDWSGRTLGPARHSAMLSLCWDDWRQGGREKINLMMQR